MALVGGELAYRMLRAISSKNTPSSKSVDPYESAEEKLITHFGQDVFERTKNQTVIDFGSGLGKQAVEIAKRGAREVVGVELQEWLRIEATSHAEQEGVSDRCTFILNTAEQGDLVYSLDSFEHFDDPAEVLESMSQLLADNGEVWISFGWSWYHPFGGHLFSVFPWAHLIFSESALIRWRTDFKTDGATRFSEVAGGLNQMTIARFIELVNASSLEFAEFHLRPISKLRFLHCRKTREFTTALTFARLVKSKGAGDG